MAEARENFEGIVKEEIDKATEKLRRELINEKVARYSDVERIVKKVLEEKKRQSQSES